MENNDNNDNNNRNINPFLDNTSFTRSGTIFDIRRNMARNRSDMYRNVFFNQLRNIILNDMNGNGNNFYRLPGRVGNTSSNNYMDILQNSLYQNNPYKKVTSSSGLSQIKKIKFKKEKHSTHICPITQEEFTENQEISQLPCKHIFETDALEMWLKDESNKCPVCRYELDSKEINQNSSRRSNDSSEEEDDDYADMPELEEDTENIPTNNDVIEGINRVISSIQFVNQPARIIQRQNAFSYDRDLQRALLSSLNDSNSETQEEEKKVDEVLEDHPDTIHDDNFDVMSDYDSSDDMFQVD